MRFLVRERTTVLQLVFPVFMVNSRVKGTHDKTMNSLVAAMPNYVRGKPLLPLASLLTFLVASIKGGFLVQH